jgi:3-hydroxybutyryl-CoA dehydrogenase
MKKINTSVIGAGTMGNGIAHVLAQSGYSVNLIDTSASALEKGLLTIGKNLDRLIKKGKLTEEEKNEALENISTFESISKDSVGNSGIVIEAVIESFDVKSMIMKTLDSFCPSDCILASNTSSISITRLASSTNRPDKIIGMHFMNPVPIMKLVEVINGDETSLKTNKFVTELARDLNKIPVTVNDFPGFISNRILMPMINEAIYALHEGVAGVGEIDEIMKLGMGHPMGPLFLADLIGLDVCIAILEVLFVGLKKPKYQPCPLLVNLVKEGKLGRKSGEGFYKYSKGAEPQIAIQFNK